MTIVLRPLVGGGWEAHEGKKLIGFYGSLYGFKQDVPATGQFHRLQLEDGRLGFSTERLRTRAHGKP